MKGEAIEPENDNDNGEDLTLCEFCYKPIIGTPVMDAQCVFACQQCAGSEVIDGGLLRALSELQQEREG